MFAFYASGCTELNKFERICFIELRFILLGIYIPIFLVIFVA